MWDREKEGIIWNEKKMQRKKIHVEKRKRKLWRDNVKKRVIRKCERERNKI